MDSYELSLWEAEYGIEPWGEFRGDLQAAIGACVTANVWRGKGKAAEVKDFLPRFGERESPADMRRKAEAWALEMQARRKLMRR